MWRMMLGAAALAACSDGAASRTESSDERAAAPEATQPASNEWADRARADLDAIHAIVEADHAAFDDPMAPGFTEWWTVGYEQGLARVDQVRDASGYTSVLRRYVAGFNNDHTYLRGPAAWSREQWAGVIVAYRNESYIVLSNDNSSGPAPGATLVSCDGVEADAFAARYLGPMTYTWERAGARERAAPYLFVDRGDPFAEPARSCRFQDGDAAVEFELPWSDITSEDLSAKIDAAQGERPPREFVVRRTESGGFWISMPTFDPLNDEIDAELERILSEVEANADEIRAAPYVVFDVRLNGGGSSRYGSQLVSILWGDAFADQFYPETYEVEWRASDANVAYWRDDVDPVLRDRYEGSEDAEEGQQWLDSLLAGWAAATQAGDKYYTETDSFGLETDEQRPTESPMTNPVFFLNDGGCASACRDFADAVLQLPGITHVGRETYPPSLFTEGRNVDLPGGVFGLNVPMKAHRWYPVVAPYEPHYVWPGSMNDTGGLESWIEQLAARNDLAKTD